MNHKFVIACVLSFGAAPIFAGPVADFDAAYDIAYATYRTALFATNTGDVDKSAGSLGELEGAWNGLMAQCSASPPPQFEADPLWDQTVDEVTVMITEAKSQVEGGDLPTAHATLERIREALGSLHARNDVETFSDRMNAYHAEMEAVLGMDMTNLDATAKQALLEHAAVLAYLASDVLSAPPHAALENPEFTGLASALQSSVDQFVAAARAGDDAALRLAVGALKVPYSKLFLKFG